MRQKTEGFSKDLDSDIYTLEGTRSEIFEDVRSMSIVVAFILRQTSGAVQAKSLFRLLASVFE